MKKIIIPSIFLTFFTSFEAMADKSYTLQAEYCVNVLSDRGWFKCSDKSTLKLDGILDLSAQYKDTENCKVWSASSNIQVSCATGIGNLKNVSIQLDESSRKFSLVRQYSDTTFVVMGYAY